MNTRNKSRNGSRKNQFREIPETVVSGQAVVTRIPRSVNNQPIVTLGQWGGTWTLFNSTFSSESDFGLNFTLSDINDYASLGNVFDAYRIIRINYSIQPNTSPVASGTTHNGCELIAAVDLDDSVSTTFATLQSFQNARTICPGKSLELIFKPKVAIAAYTGTFSGYATRDDEWIDCASSTVQHYGVKVAVGGQYSSSIYHSWFGRAYYTIQFRYRH